MSSICLSGDPIIPTTFTGAASLFTTLYANNLSLLLKTASCIKRFYGTSNPFTQNLPSFDEVAKDFSAGPENFIKYNHSLVN